ncbi:hypothetical protein HYX11_04060 [Candidatus Woesearchaeota archaeon]|nr:hypothetical protein [Candidatus Woesearchaeota archaeon]
MMVSNKNIKSSLFFILCSISLLSFYVEALAITPPKVDLNYFPGTYQEFVFKVTDTENLEVDLEGDLLNNAKKPFITEQGAGLYFVKVGLDIPVNLSPGSHSLDLLLGDKGKNEGEKSSSVSAKMKIRVPISFIVPYPNKYLKINGWNWDKNVVKGNPLHVAINVHSYGKEKIDKVSGKIIVKDMFEKNLIQEKTLSETSDINFGEDAEIEGLLMLPNDWPFGNYNVKAVLNYDGQEFDTQEYYFIYGDLLLEIVGVNPLEIGKGAIVPITIEVQNYWSEKVDFAAKVKVYDLNDNLIVEGVSSQGDVPPLRKGTIKLFLEGTDLKNGDYNLEVLLSYQGKETKKNFVLKVTDKKNEMEAGEEVLLNKEDENNNLLIISLVIIVVILILGIIYVLKKDQEGMSEI